MPLAAYTSQALLTGQGADASSEASYISGVDAFGNGAANDWWQSQSSFARKWGDVAPGTSGGTVTYAFDSSPYWSASDQAAISAGLALWSAVANIKFTQLAELNSAQVFIHLFESTGDPSGTYDAPIGPAGIGAPYIGTLTGADAAIDFNPASLNILGLSSFTQFGGYGIDTILHEEGHMLGLGHAGAYNEFASPATQQLGAYDTRQWSLMSYIDPADGSARYRASYAYPGANWGTTPDGRPRVPTTWMPFDVLAAQRLYGAPASTPLSGGQVFGFHCNVDLSIRSFFDFTINQNPIVTLWDAGRGNTLDVSGFAIGAAVDLRPGAFSSVDGMTDNIGIAFGTAIDAAVGGPGNNSFVLNADSDSIVGGGGADQAVETAAGAEFHDYAGPSRLLVGAGASDTLVGIGALAFTGGRDTVSSDAGGGFALYGGNNVLFLGPQNASVALGGADTLIASGGATQVSAMGAAGAGGDLVYGGSGPLVFDGGATPDTIVGGAATVYGGSGGVVAFGSGPSLLFRGGAGYNVAVSGAGQFDAQAGVGGGLLVAPPGGGSLLQANGGSTVVFAGGAGDVVSLTNAALDVVVLGHGPETVAGASAGAGFVAYTEAADAVVYGGPGNDVLGAGTGNDTLSGGGGINSFVFSGGQGGGADVITDFDPSRDYVFLSGFGPPAGADAQAVASQMQVGGNTVVTLPDRTQITFLGVHGLAASSFY